MYINLILAIYWRGNRATSLYTKVPYVQRSENFWSNLALVADTLRSKYSSIIWEPFEKYLCSSFYNTKIVVLGPEHIRYISLEWWLIGITLLFLRRLTFVYHIISSTHSTIISIVRGSLETPWKIIHGAALIIDDWILLPLIIVLYVPYLQELIIKPSCPTTVCRTSLISILWTHHFWGPPIC